MILLILFYDQQGQGLDLVLFLLIKLCFIIELDYGTLNMPIFVLLLLYWKSTKILASQVLILTIELRTWEPVSFGAVPALNF